MAIFASTTTSGYSDPLKAYSIKALELRQKDMMAQQAAEQAKMFTPENTQTPIQGIAQVANVAADAFKQRRADDALASQKQELAGLIASGDPMNPTPQVQARMAVLAPDMYKDVLGVIRKRRRPKNSACKNARPTSLSSRCAGRSTARKSVRRNTTPAKSSLPGRK
jgi:hypothetical protein